MEELLNIGITEKEIKNMIEINPNIKELDNQEILKNILILKNEGCNETQLKNIIVSNPFYLSRSIDDLIHLISKLNFLGITNLNVTFDSNSWLLNKDSFEIDEFLEQKINQGMSKEEAIDLIDSGMID